MDSERQPADAVFFCAVRRRISCDDTTQVFAEKKAAATNIRGATVCIIRVIEDKQFYAYGVCILHPGVRRNDRCTYGEGG